MIESNSLLEEGQFEIKISIARSCDRMLCKHMRSCHVISLHRNVHFAKCCVNVEVDDILPRPGSGRRRSCGTSWWFLVSCSVPDLHIRINWGRWFPSSFTPGESGLIALIALQYYAQLISNWEALGDYLGEVFSQLTGYPVSRYVCTV